MKKLKPETSKSKVLMKPGPIILKYKILRDSESKDKSHSRYKTYKSKVLNDSKPTT